MSRNIKQDQADAEHEINDCHKRYNDLADRRDSLQSSDQDQRQHRRDRIKEEITTAQEYEPRNGIAHAVCLVRIKEILHRTGNTVYLAEGTDTEQSDTDTEKCKNLRQPFPVVIPYLFLCSRKVRQGCVRPPPQRGI